MKSLRPPSHLVKFACGFLWFPFFLSVCSVFLADPSFIFNFSLLFWRKFWKCTYFQKKTRKYFQNSRRTLVFLKIFPCLLENSEYVETSWGFSRTQDLLSGYLILIFVIGQVWKKTRDHLHFYNFTFLFKISPCFWKIFLKKKGAPSFFVDNTYLFGRQFPTKTTSLWVSETVC